MSKLWASTLFWARSMATLSARAPDLVLLDAVFHDDENGGLRVLEALRPDPIRVAMLSVEAVHHVERLLTMQLASHEILVTAEVAFDEGADEVAAIAEIEANIVAGVPDAKQIFIEPVAR